MANRLTGAQTLFPIEMKIRNLLLFSPLLGLSALRNHLMIGWIKKNEREFCKDANEVEGWIKSGLRDFPISRASIEWGIPVPNYTKQTIYVWFDALLGVE